jgi:predicted kinase
MKIIIIRGISGSGKSTHIAKHFPNAYVVSADHFFGTGANYNFDPKKLGAAHADCLEKFKQAIRRHVPEIVVDNTNTQLWEFSKYVEFAKENGYVVTVVRLKIDPAVAAKRNIHGVPEEKVKQMQGRFQDYPGEIVINNG